MPFGPPPTHHSPNPAPFPFTWPVTQRDAHDRFKTSLGTYRVGELNKLLMQAAKAPTPQLFDATMDKINSDSPDYYTYVTGAFPPNTWACRGGRPVTCFGFVTNNPAGTHDSAPCFASLIATVTMSHC